MRVFWCQIGVFDTELYNGYPYVRFDSREKGMTVDFLIKMICAGHLFHHVYEHDELFYCTVTDKRVERVEVVDSALHKHLIRSFSCYGVLNEFDRLSYETLWNSALIDVGLWVFYIATYPIFWTWLVNVNGEVVDFRVNMEDGQ